MTTHFIKNIHCCVWCILFLNFINHSFAQTTDNQEDSLQQFASNSKKFSYAYPNSDAQKGVAKCLHSSLYDVSIDLGKEEDNATVRLYDEYGSFLRQYSAVSGRFFKLSLQEFPAGTYFIQVNNHATFTLAKL